MSYAVRPIRRIKGLNGRELREMHRRWWRRDKDIQEEYEWNMRRAEERLKRESRAIMQSLQRQAVHDPVVAFALSGKPFPWSKAFGFPVVLIVAIVLSIMVLKWMKVSQ